MRLLLPGVLRTRVVVVIVGGAAARGLDPLRRLHILVAGSALRVLLERARVVEVAGAATADHPSVRRVLARHWPAQLLRRR